MFYLRASSSGKSRAAITSKTVIVRRIAEVLGVSSGFHGAQKLIDNLGRGIRKSPRASSLTLARMGPTNRPSISACSTSTKRPSRRFCAAKNAFRFAAERCRAMPPAGFALILQVAAAVAGDRRHLVWHAALRQHILALPARLQRQHHHLRNEQRHRARKSWT